MNNKVMFTDSHSCRSSRTRSTQPQRIRILGVLLVVLLCSESWMMMQLVDGFIERSIPSKHHHNIHRRWRLWVTPTSEDAEPNTPPTTTMKVQKEFPTGKVLQQTVIIDGPEWQSVQQQLLRLQTPPPQQQSPEQPLSSSSNYNRYKTSSCGIYHIVTGSIQGRRMVGMQHLLSSSTSDTVVTLDQDDTIQVYQESIAYIPKDVTELDALWTMIQSFSTIHCCRPILRNIGASTLSSSSSSSTSDHHHSTMVFVPSQVRIVVVGNNPSAVQIASILHQVFQYNVTMVATTTPINTKDSSSSSTSKDSINGIQYLPPSIESTMDDTDNNDSSNDDDDDDTVLLGFAAMVGQFDVLIDTIGNEWSNSIIQENLKALHNCYIYISTVSESQRIILQNGLIFGPNQSKEHIRKITTAAQTSNGSSTNKNQPAYFPSPFGLGMTIETILQKGMVLKPPSTSANNKNGKDAFVRSWSLKDFWEYTTWPRDATTSNSRFGFPSDVSATQQRYYDNDFLDDDNDDGIGTGSTPQKMISAPPLRSTPGRDMFQARPENFEFEIDDENEAGSMRIGSSLNRSTPQDRYVMDVATVHELQSIVQKEMTCIVFVSAPFCRTCRYLKPQFARMAREYRTAAMNRHSMDNTATVSDSFLFIKAEASGQMGKDIGRALGIDTVPTFILYKYGRRYGTPITSVTRLPSKALDETIMALMQNRTVNFSSLFPTDTSSIDDDNDNRMNKNRSRLT